MLLERVFLRIGSAETDDQLQNAVSKFLPPVLLKLSSQQEGVRKKVNREVHFFTIYYKLMAFLGDGIIGTYKQTY